MDALCRCDDEVGGDGAALRLPAADTAASASSVYSILCHSEIPDAAHTSLCETTHTQKETLKQGYE